MKLITTPIYYSNWIPHVGHSYSSFLADILARYYRNFDKVLFSTWVDENSQKLVLAAEKAWVSTESYLEKMASEHQKVWDWINISYDDFVRTTEVRHHQVVREILQKTFNAWDIYQWEYNGLYCIGCEAFKKEDELIEKDWKKLCPDHLTEPEKISEKNYFFKLSKYEKQLLEFYEKNPDFVQPASKFNEVKAFVKSGLEDFSISRASNKIWIKLPFDESQVTYVWYDALINYITVCWENPEQAIQNFDKADVTHIVWKDIIRFHAIYWPAMLMAAWINEPKNIFCTWYFTNEGQKISKSLGNVIDPVELLQTIDRDGLVMYLFYDIKIWNDWDFSVSRLQEQYNSVLIWGYWNMVSRVFKLAQKNNISSAKKSAGHSNDQFYFDQIKTNSNLSKVIENWDLKLLYQYFSKADFQSFFKDWYELVQNWNKFVNDTKPWEKIKNWDESWIEILQFLIWLIKQLATVSSPMLINWYQKFLNMVDSKDLKWSLEDLKIENFEVDLKPENMYERKI